MEGTSLRIRIFNLMLTMIADKHRSASALIVSGIRDPYQPVDNTGVQETEEYREAR